MPMHDWTRVAAGIFHDFHHEWISEIKRALNRGLLPADYYALAEQQATKSSISVRHVSGDRVVAMIEIVSPGNKSDTNAFQAFVGKACELLELRVHLLIVDPFPPG